jgi:hypothetical protein
MGTITGWYRCLAVGATVVTLSLSAMAELGGMKATVETDRLRVSGTRRVLQTPAYEMHEIRTANKGTIHEYVSSDGKVFAVTYEGQFPGESNGLLGKYSAQVTQALAASRGTRPAGHNVRVDLPGLRYHALGHLRYFSMRAIVPENVPAGVNVEELQ